jgi:hypothetical protein
VIANGHLLVATIAYGTYPMVYGTGCKAALLGPPFAVVAPSPVLDPAHHRLLVAGTDLANLHRASLLTLDLW